MKFESKFGIGEVVALTKGGMTKNMHGFVYDELLEVIVVNFEEDAVRIICRAPNLMIVALKESELDGYIHFDQDAGKYPDSILIEAGELEPNTIT
jgi:hypothetical protein